MGRKWFAIAVLVCSACLVAAEAKKRTLAEDAELLGAGGGTGWMSEPVPVTVEARALGGARDDRLRLAFRFRPKKDASSGTFVFGLLLPDDKDAKVIQRPLKGTFELSEKDGNRVLGLVIEQDGKKLTLRVRYVATGNTLTLPDGLGLKGWDDGKGVTVRLDRARAVVFAAT